VGEACADEGNGGAWVLFCFVWERIPEEEGGEVASVDFGKGNQRARVRGGSQVCRGRKPKIPKGRDGSSWSGEKIRFRVL